MSDLVLIPGINNTRATWDGVIAALPPGITARAEDCAALPTVEAVAADLLPRLPPRFHLCGFSFGGYVALALFAQAPQRVASLVMLATTSFADTPQQQVARDTAAAAAQRGEHMTLVAGPGAIALHPTAAADPAIAALRLRIARDYGAERFIAHQFASKARPDRTALLAGAKLPMLFIASGDDKVIPPDAVRRMADAVPLAKFETIPGAGHLVPIEQPTAVARLLGDWVRANT